MTLARQLILSGLVVLFGLFLGMMDFMIKNTQQFLNAQLSENAQETANVLGLSLSTIMKKKDTIFAARMVDSIWDAGYYKKIKVIGLDNTVWTDKEQKIVFEGVPQWFINAISLTTYSKEAVIQSGWMQIGHVIVESNPGFAYKQIWQTTKDSVIWLGWMAFIGAILGSFLLYVILKPLRAITKQANALAHQQFYIVKPLPWTADLRKVVQAMNTMSRRLQAIFEENARRSLELQNQAYKSIVTQLPNRRYFDLQFANLLNDKEHSASGVFALLEITHFKLLNEKEGYKAGDNLLKNTAQIIQSDTLDIEDVILAHLGGAHFAMILAKKTKEEAIIIAEKILQHFVEMKGTNHPEQNMGIGLCLINSEKTASELLAQADMAVRNALFQDQNQWHFSEASLVSNDIMSASEWIDFFKEVIKRKAIVLYYQNYRIFRKEEDSQYEEEKYYEVLLRLKDDKDNLMSAGIFMPVAERLFLMPELDKLVIEAIVHKIKENHSHTYYSINISPNSLDSPDFIKWVLERVRLLGSLAQYIIIELPEYGVITRLPQVRDFFGKLTYFGCKTAIDHYGKGFSSFAYLKSLQLSFLKIDGSYTAQIQDSKENQFFVQSLITIAHTLDIKVIAESVETQAEFDKVNELKVDGAQGYFLGQPQIE